MPDVIVRGRRVLIAGKGMGQCIDDGDGYIAWDGQWAHRRWVAGQRVSELQPAALHIEGGIIKAITAYEELAEGAPVIDAGEAVIMPGLVDSHVHCNEPGRTEWEGFESATQAAAAGGVTTLIDMPLNSSPVTTCLAALEEKRKAAEGHCWVDIGFFGGIVPGNGHELAALHQAGVRGFKCFLCPSGIDDCPATAGSAIVNGVLVAKIRSLSCAATLDSERAAKWENAQIRCA